MIKKIMLLVLLITSTQIFAFFDKVNLYGGANFASITGDLDTDAQFGFKIGAQGIKPLSNVSFISIGLEYLTKNSEKSGAFTVNSNKVKLESESQWLEVPILYNHKFDKFSVYGGGYISYVLDESYKDGRATGEEDIFEEMDYGIKVGAAYQITEAGSLYLDYTRGFVDIEIPNSDSQISSFSFGYSHLL